jgi:hypothetical protein
MRARRTMDADDLREKRERELRWQAAKSAAICGQCFHRLAASDSVTKYGPLTAPICLLCSLTDIKLRRWRGCDAYHEQPQWHRTRCLNCGRPLRIQLPFGRYLENWRPSLNERCCCRDCQRAVRNKRNAERRRVEHQPMTCIECGRSFIPKRDDAVTCSNRCRQAQHRKRARAELGGGSYPLRKPLARRERRSAR